MTDVIATYRATARSALALLYGARVPASSVMRHLLAVRAMAKALENREPFGIVTHTELTLNPSDLATADRLIERADELGVTTISAAEDRYPRFLRIIPAAPPLIFLRGDVALLDQLPGVAIVGSRQGTPNGLEIAKRISNFLATKGWPIVSGLALGIDAAAHRGALDAKGKTIAVLAHGLHRSTPAQNSALAEEILATGGLWLSEHAPDIPPRKQFFVQRNRIQAGLSAGSIIVEGEIESGSMTQAEYCLGQKRKLFAVVPRKGDRSLGLLSAGPEMLVNTQGAVPISSMSDYAGALAMLIDSRKSLLDDAAYSDVNVQAGL